MPTSDLRLDPNDNGTQSRKFWILILSQILIVGVAILGGWKPAIAGVFPALVGGVLALDGMYFTANIANKALVAKEGIDNKKVDNAAIGQLAAVTKEP